MTYNPCETGKGEIDLQTRRGAGDTIQGMMYKLYVTLILVAEMVALSLLSLVVADVVVLALAPVIPLTVVLAFVVHHRRSGLSFKARRLSPDRIANYTPQEVPVVSPERLSRSLVERAGQIRRVLQDSPSEAQKEMCTFGYRTCVNDMITLTNLVNEELRGANLIRRIKLNRARKQATSALAETRQALPPGALRTTRQEQQ